MSIFLIPYIQILKKYIHTFISINNYSFTFHYRCNNFSAFLLCNNWSILTLYRRGYNLLCLLFHFLYNIISFLFLYFLSSIFRYISQFPTCSFIIFIILTLWWWKHTFNIQCGIKFLLLTHLYKCHFIIYEKIKHM